MLSRIGLSSLRARSSASGPHGYQSTGIVRVLQEVRTGLVREAIGHCEK